MPQISDGCFLLLGLRCLGCALARARGSCYQRVTCHFFLLIGFDSIKPGSNRCQHSLRSSPLPPSQLPQPTCSWGSWGTCPNSTLLHPSSYLLSTSNWCSRLQRWITSSQLLLETEGSLSKTPKNCCDPPTWDFLPWKHLRGYFHHFHHHDWDC